MRDLTKEELNAINSLQRLAKRWPKSLWLFSASGSLKVMMYDEDGKRYMRNREDMDHGAIAATIVGIPNDGGDW